jgi:hypothetical protein
MAAQVVTTVVNYDSAAISGLLNGEIITTDAPVLTAESGM